MKKRKKDGRLLLIGWCFYYHRGVYPEKKIKFRSPSVRGLKQNASINADGKEDEIVLDITTEKWTKIKNRWVKYWTDYDGYLGVRRKNINGK